MPLDKAVSSVEPFCLFVLIVSNFSLTMVLWKDYENYAFVNDFELVLMSSNGPEPSPRPRPSLLSSIFSVLYPSVALVSFVIGSSALRILYHSVLKTLSSTVTSC